MVRSSRRVAQRWRSVLSVIAVTLSSGALPSIASYDIVAAVAPGDTNPAGGVFSAVTQPVFLEGTQLAFIGSSDAIVVNTPSGVVTIAYAGAANPNGGTFVRFGEPVEAPGSVVAFYAVGSDPDTTGIFKWDGSLSTIAHAGQTAPGDLGKFIDFNPGLAFGPGGELSFVATTSAGGGAAVLVHSAGDTAIAAEVGTSLAGGGTLTGVTRPLLFNAGADLAFAGRVNSVLANGIALLVRVGGVVRVAAIQGAPTPCEDNFGAINVAQATSSLDSAGRLVFSSTAGGSSRRGLFRYDPIDDAVTALVCPDDDGPEGGVFQTVGKFPATNSSGDVVFTGTMRLVAGTPRGVFLHSPERCAPSAICAVALEGDPAAGALISSVRSAARPAIDDNGAIAFDARLAFPDPSQSGRAIVAFNGGALGVLARESGACDGGGVYTRIVNGAAIDDLGRVLFRGSCSSAGAGVYAGGASADADPVVLHTAVTPLGSGLRFPDTVHGGPHRAFRARRTAVFSADCSTSPCTGTTPILEPPLALPNGDAVVFSGLSGKGGSLAVLAGQIGDVREALLEGSDSSLEVSALRGDPATDTPDETFDDFNVLSFVDNSGVDLPPAINPAAGAFTAVLSDGTVGLYHRVGADAPVLVLRTFDTSPMGREISEFGGPALEGETLAAIAREESAYCLYLQAEEALDAILCSGDTPPAPLDGQIDSLGSIAGTGGGGFAFLAHLVDDAVPPALIHDCAMHLNADYSLDALACGGDVDPSATGFDLGSLSQVVAGAGTVAFTARRTLDSSSGIFAASGSSPVEPVIVDGQALPAAIGGAFNIFALRTGSLVAEGERIAFAVDTSAQADGADAIVLGIEQ